MEKTWICTRCEAQNPMGLDDCQQCGEPYLESEVEISNEPDSQAPDYELHQPQPRKLPGFIQVLAVLLFLAMFIGSLIMGNALGWPTALGGIVASILVLAILYAVGSALERLDDIHYTLWDIRKTIRRKGDDVD